MLYQRNTKIQTIRALMYPATNFPQRPKNMAPTSKTGIISTECIISPQCWVEPSVIAELLLKMVQHPIPAIKFARLLSIIDM